MFGDLMLFAAACYLLYIQPLNPLVWVLILAVYRVWKSQGGFIAWKPKQIKDFLKNARACGL